MATEILEGVGIRESFVSRVRNVLKDVEYRLAKSTADLDAIYRLRYDANLREGAISPNDSCRLVDKHDVAPNVFNFAIYIKGELISALRIHVLDAENPRSPALEAFTDLLEPRVKAGATTIDGNRFVANYPKARSYPQLPYITLRLGMLAAEYFGAEFIVASVRSEHVAFYQREYFAEKLCEPRPYPTLVKPLSLISIDYLHDRDTIVGRHPFYESTPEERQQLFGEKPHAAHSLAAQ